jgi:hypothetical protein
MAGKFSVSRVSTKSVDNAVDKDASTVRESSKNAALAGNAAFLGKSRKALK